MRRLRAGASLAATLLVVASCVDKGAPTSPTVTSVTISSSADMLKVKETFTFTATAVRSDGSSVVVNDWRSDTPAVATVEATTGKVTGVGPGIATLIATYDGTSATKAVRVVPDFDGNWEGQLRLLSCTASGDWTKPVAGWDRCDTYTPIGPAWFDFSQAGERVTGTVGFGIVLDAGGQGAVHPTGGPAAGWIDEGGHLKLTGVFVNPTDRLTFTLTAAGNDLYIQSERMRGSFRVELTSATVPGRATMAYRINGDGLTKVQ